MEEDLLRESMNAITGNSKKKKKGKKDSKKGSKIEADSKNSSIIATEII